MGAQAEAAPTPSPAVRTAQAMGQAQSRSELEQQRQEGDEQAKKTIVPEAAAAIEETRKALEALEKGQSKQALAALERATGKMDILLARYPDKALLPVSYKVEVIDSAPEDPGAILEAGREAATAVRGRRYHDARVHLDILRSEINVRTYHLPLALYPKALKNAARLLGNGQAHEASATLHTALNTLVIINRVIPIPLATAKILLASAEAARQKDKDGAVVLLVAARGQLERAKVLGYAGRDAEYTALDRAIRDLEKQVQGDHASVAATFRTIRDRLAAFFERQSGAKKQSHQA